MIVNIVAVSAVDSSSECESGVYVSRNFHENCARHKLILYITGERSPQQKLRLC